MLNLNQNIKNAAAQLQAQLGGLSQNQLAEHIGYTAGYFSMLINGKVAITASAKEKLKSAGFPSQVLEAQCPTCGQTLPQNDKEAYIKV